jgi:hypothetical protein
MARAPGKDPVTQLSPVQTTFKINCMARAPGKDPVTQLSPVQTTFKNQKLRANFDKVPVLLQITDRYTWKTLNNRSEEVIREG